ncbi:kinase-like protein [Ascodesmis nigricans]|uniref:Kinase-like protein n=1 Tax=Ascodesmis nigricans TaxID=341454 RepID=A0A4S2MQ79_9PEZI|nr:kinase-like protein [Ascodesmis nigricans]
MLSKAEVQRQRAKLVNSYQELLTEFSSPDLRSVGNYNVGRLIGKGSFGKVYIASHKLINGSKVVLKSAQKDDANLAREIHHHRQLIHPHIARLYEVVVTETLVWLVLEYCPGDELFDYLLKNGRIPVEKTRKIFAQLVGAVSYVHMNHCVHRDLKLENILMDANENVKLCDFGFTREYEKNKLLQTFCGTVCYCAPEMLKGERYIAQGVDVWSLGVILYALLRGELPFDEEIEDDTKRMILTGEPKYPDDMPDDAVSLIKAMLQKVPSQRPTLNDVLSHPFLAEHAPAQRAILAVQVPPPFSTQLEKDCLKRLKSAGVDTEQVVENVLAKKCDALAGWWNLLIEKEERKEKRRQKRKIESRRMSAASTLEAFLPPAVAEEHEPEESKRRGSENNPIIILPHKQKRPPVRPRTPSSPRPPPIEKDSEYNPYLRPPLSPSALQVRSSPDLRSQAEEHKNANRPNRKQTLMMQLAAIKHWFLDSAKRATSPHSKPNPHHRIMSRRHSNSNKPHHHHHLIHPQYIGNGSNNNTTSSLTAPSRSSNSSRKRPTEISHISTHHHRSTTPHNHPNYTHNSLSPSPLTPRSTYRRHSGRGLGSRHSTSSSVSSIRSFHNKTHSKASSTSSASITSITLKTPRSPRASVKLLPATPTASSSMSASTPFPAYVRLQRGGYNEAAVITTFAKPKRNIFKGPMSSRAKRDSAGSAASSVGRKRGGGGIIEEEEEEEDVGLGIGVDSEGMEAEEVEEFGEIDGAHEVLIIDDEESEEEEGRTVREQKRPATSG